MNGQTITLKWCSTLLRLHPSLVHALLLMHSCCYYLHFFSLMLTLLLLLLPLLLVLLLLLVVVLLQVHVVCFGPQGLSIVLSAIIVWLPLTIIAPGKQCIHSINIVASIRCRCCSCGNRNTREFLLTLLYRMAPPTGIIHVLYAHRCAVPAGYQTVWV